MIKLLHLDDDIDILEIGRMSLELTGAFEIRQVLSGEEAIEAAQEFQPDVMLLDVMVPGTSGITVHEEIRKIPSLKDVPVIFMTARVQREEVDSLLARGAVGVIAKPFDPVALGNEVFEILNRTRAAA